jgi:hypothetical protein
VCCGMLCMGVHGGGVALSTTVWGQLSRSDILSTVMPPVLHQGRWCFVLRFASYHLHEFDSWLDTITPTATSTAAVRAPCNHPLQEANTPRRGLQPTTQPPRRRCQSGSVSPVDTPRNTRNTNGIREIPNTEREERSIRSHRPNRRRRRAPGSRLLPIQSTCIGRVSSGQQDHPRTP